MKYNTINTIIDDIMLEMRRNNITESESYGRKQIEQWIIQYRSLLLKELANSKLPMSYNYYQRFSLELEEEDIDLYKSLDKVPEFFCSDIGDRFITSYDEFNNEIQVMSTKRSSMNKHSRHFFTGKKSSYVGRDKKYHLVTPGDLVDPYEPITIDIDGIFINPTEVPDFDYDNDMYPMDPGSLPRLKQMIFQGELKFNLIPDMENDGKEQRFRVASK